jgi:signal transduction histidine kinase
LLEICLSNTERLVRLINSILDIAKIEAGRIELKLAPQLVADIVRVAIDGIRSFAEARAATIAAEIPPDLPAVPGDAERLVQVPTDLLSNAIKFSPLGALVRVRASQADDGVAIAVCDQGHGISAEDRPKLFQKFRQLDARSVREAGGTGLGLAICRGIVDEHGGRIEVDSQLGVGTTFTVVLPRT